MFVFMPIILAAQKVRGKEQNKRAIQINAFLEREFPKEDSKGNLFKGNPWSPF